MFVTGYASVSFVGVVITVERENYYMIAVMITMIVCCVSSVRISGVDQNKENQHPAGGESYDNIPDYDNLGDDSSDEESIRWRDDDDDPATQSKS